jgi:hypothetical protein
MSHVEHCDLLDPARLDLLWQDAARRGLAPASEHGRLQVFAAAARAVRLAKSSAPAFFASVVRRGLWAHLSSIDEDRSRSLLAGGRQSAHTLPAEGRDSWEPQHVVRCTVRQV